LEYVLGKTDEFGENGGWQNQAENGELVEDAEEAPAVDATEEEVHAPERARRARQDTGDETRMEMDEEEADLPETPHDGILPGTFQDSPPRGILFSTPRRRKRKEREALKKAISTPAVEEAAPAEELPAYVEQESQLTPGEQLILEEKQAILARVKEELRELKDETRKYERHIQLDRDTSVDATYKDLDGLM
jgi:hypothetical protein